MYVSFLLHREYVIVQPIGEDADEQAIIQEKEEVDDSTEGVLIFFLLLLLLLFCCCVLGGKKSHSTIQHPQFTWTHDERYGCGW